VGVSGPMGSHVPAVGIVGAGPAGLVIAHILQRAGISFVLFERQQADALRSRVKAGMIEHRTLGLLESHGLAGPILERGSRMGMCEFRADGESFILDYASQCGGVGHYIYPQHQLVGDWAEQLAAGGGDTRFGVTVTGVAQGEEAAEVAAVNASGDALSLDCDAVACCDGAASLLGAGMTDTSIDYPVRWLTMIADAPPSTQGTIYGLHRDGFAGQMHRSRTITRFMLEVPAGEGFDTWPDDRIWSALTERLVASGRPPLEQGDFLERDVLDHRVRVLDSMQDGRLYFAGDAAHLITPAGGKGMNMAIQDAIELAAGLCERYGPAHDGRRLARYSQTRFPSIWRHQEFSNLMLSLFNRGPAGAEAFSYGLRRARLDLIINDAGFSRWFAHAYVGIDI
jgi:p-hydroxybenzoate 3-monooxygenase